MVLKYKQVYIFWNGKEKIFELKTENRDTELKTLTEWISGQIQIASDLLVNMMQWKHDAVMACFSAWSMDRTTLLHN